MIKNLLVKALLVVGIFVSTSSFAQNTVTIQVGLGGNFYSPANVSCTVGDTIKFVWVSGFHPTQSTDGTTIPLVDMDGTGGINSVYKIKMLSAGSVPYECTAHGGMGGTITVNAPFVATSYIPFSGTGALNANSWSTHSGTAAQVQVLTTSSDVGNSLSYAGLPTSQDNRIQLVAGNSEDLNRQIPIVNNSGSVYYSALIKLPNTTGQAANGVVGNYFMHLSDTSGAVATTGFVGRLHIKAGATPNTFNLGILNNSGGTPTVAQVYGASPVDYLINQTHLVVVKYTFATNSASLWVNPVISSTEPSATVVNNFGTGSAPLKSKSICIREAGNASAGTGNIEIDEIRVTNNWNDVLGLVIPPSVKFNPTSVSINENAGTANVTLNITNPNASATSVDVLVKGGSATAGSDYTFTSQTVTFPANSSTAQSFTIPIIDDVDQESDETISLVLRNTTNSATIEADSIFTITISANDITNPVVNFVAPYSVTKEEGTNHIFSVGITNPNSNSTGVKVYVKSTSTASSTDYAGINASGIPLTFPANSSSNQSENVNIVDDAIAEGAETVILVLRDATNSATIGNDSIIVITIPQNDQPLTAHFIGTSANVNENAVEANISVMAMGASSSAPTSFDVVYKSGTATQGSDFTFTTQTITIPAAKDSTVVIKVPILNDNLFENDETVVLAIRNITNSGNISTDSIFTLTIKSDDILFKNISALKVNDANGVSILKDSSVYIKGIVYGVDMQGSATSLQYTLIDPTGGVGIFRSGANNPPVISLVPEEGDSVRVYGKVAEFNGLTQVNMDSIILISKGNALKAPRVITSLDESTESDLVRFNNAVIVDTIANTGSGTTLRIVSGTDSMDLRIDADVNLFNQPFPSQRFSVIGLGGQFDNSNPKNSGYQLLPRSINDIIAVPDPTIMLDSASFSVSEAAGTKVIKVKLSSPAPVAGSIRLAVTGGTATSGTDYTFTSPATLNFIAGATEAQTSFTITDDNTNEVNETITIGLNTPVNCVIGTPASATITIIDNDPIGININKALNFNLFPNPATESVNVIASETIENIMIVNMIGQTITSINSINETNKTVNVSELSAGVYNVIITTKNGSASQRLVIK